jgi:hypothetical protein
LYNCSQALKNVPRGVGLNFRLLTPTSGTGSNETWLIGGTIDLMYIPGSSRENFMMALEPFLETDCYSQIAAPTALHLAVPPGEHISYIDFVSPLSTFLASSLTFCSVGLYNTDRC